LTDRGADSIPSMKWADLSARAGRNDLPAILLTALAMGALSDPQEIRVGLEQAWTTCEWPGRAADYDVWLYAFGEAGADGHYLEETELRSHTALPERLTIYRAATEGHELGLSWTTSFERAHWFATRVGAISGHRSKIYEIDAPRDLVLARYNDTRNENEYVIDTSDLGLDDLYEVTPDEWEYRLAGEREP